jgi:protein TonB
MARGEGESERKKVERPPVAKKRVFPEYPSIARRAGLEGRVVARVLVDERGRVARLDRIEGHAVFREAVEAAARQWEFAPAMQGELAVSAWIAIPFVFRLE